MNEVASRDLSFKTREEWRIWLQKNHAKADEVWLVLQKKNSKKTGLRYSEAIEEALCYGWIDSKMNRIDEDTFRQRFSPRRKNSIWSRRNKEMATQLIKDGRMARAGYEAIEDGKRSGRWQKAYSSRITPEVPDALQTALQSSSKAQSNFEAFSNSTKLIYIHWIQSAKKKETRARRIKQVVERAEKNIKPS
jgi:uncharacterized protein YdeI (YjbR/CyaY-like superfamily)